RRAERALGGRLVAIIAGAIAIAARTNGSWHAFAGRWLFGSMLVLGVTASILAWFKTPPELGILGILACCFVATSWVTARRRDGTTGTSPARASGTVLCGGRAADSGSFLRGLGA